MGVEVADHVTAAVVVDDERGGALAARRDVEASRDRSRGAAQLDVGHALDLDPRPGEDPGLAAATSALLGDRAQPPSRR